MRIFIALVVALALNGCAIAALPLAAQLPIWGAAAGGAAAVGSLAVISLHDCKQDNGCKAVPLPP